MIHAVSVRTTYTSGNSCRVWPKKLVDVTNTTNRMSNTYVLSSWPSVHVIYPYKSKHREQEFLKSEMNRSESSRINRCQTVMMCCLNTRGFASRSNGNWRIGTSQPMLSIHRYNCTRTSCRGFTYVLVVQRTYYFGVTLSKLKWSHVCHFRPRRGL